jgi:hypothetical protein
MDIKSLSANLSPMNKTIRITRDNDSAWGRWLLLSLTKKTKNGRNSENDGTYSIDIVSEFQLKFLAPKL